MEKENSQAINQEALNKQIKLEMSIPVIIRTGVKIELSSILPEVDGGGFDTMAGINKSIEMMLAERYKCAKKYIGTNITEEKEALLNIIEYINNQLSVIVGF